MICFNIWTSSGSISSSSPTSSVGSLSASALSSASSTISNSSSNRPSTYCSFVALGCTSCTAGHLLRVTHQTKGTFVRQGVDAQEGVWLKPLALPHPLTEGAGELVSKWQKLLAPNVSSSSSSDKAGLKVLENDLWGIGACCDIGQKRVLIKMSR